MFFFSFFNTNIWFVEKKITWRRYIAVKILSAIKRVKLINKKEFAIVTLDVDSKTFIIHIVALDIRDITMAIYPSWVAQIGLLKISKAPIIDFIEYSNYTYVFLLNLSKNY